MLSAAYFALFALTTFAVLDIFTNDSGSEADDCEDNDHLELFGTDDADTYHVDIISDDTSAPSDENGKDQPIAVIKDFVPGVDTLEIQYSSYHHSVRMEVDHSAGLTYISFIAPSPTGEASDEDAFITIESTGLLWSDVVFLNKEGDPIRVWNYATIISEDELACDNVIDAGNRIESAYGGGGDDYIRSTTRASDVVGLYGGDGNDEIDATMVDNADVFGGSGDDILRVAGNGDHGTGHSITPYGGAGDDLLIFETREYDHGWTTASYLYGGEGNDRFHINIRTDDVAGPYGGDRYWAATIRDYSSEDDPIHVEIHSGDSSYMASTARIDQITYQYNDGGERVYSDLVVTLVADGLPDREVSVSIDGAGITWDDVEFVGDIQPTTLAPVA